MSIIKEMRKKSSILFFSFIVFLWIGSAAVFVSCKEAKEPLLPNALYYVFNAPAHFPTPVYDFKNNPISKEGFEVGRLLFYDPVLSRDSTVSCASCHQQFVAFAHSGHAKSHGIDNQVTLRNSPGLFNMAWQKDFFWDGGVNHLELVPLAPIANPLEMDESLAKVIYKLNRSRRYSDLFQKAFGKDTIDSQQLLYALTQFNGLMVSADSKYDRYRTQKEILSAMEQEGLQLFTQKCAACHSGELFTDLSFRNNGLNTSFTNDTGRGHITTLSSDIGKFKVPSLRNVELTSPYMHDGRFSTLEEVLDHYSKGVKASPTLDPLLDKGNGTYGIALSAAEKQKIILFLNTLTDHSFLTDPRFTNPF
jgi:cytochrome c peroxidase